MADSAPRFFSAAEPGEAVSVLATTTGTEGFGLELGNCGAADERAEDRGAATGVMTGTPTDGREGGPVVDCADVGAKLASGGRYRANRDRPVQSAARPRIAGRVRPAPSARQQYSRMRYIED